jgi:phytoene synthase
LSPEEYCRRKTLKSGTSFYYSFLFLDNEQKIAISALYSICRILDDIADKSNNIDISISKLNWWKFEIDQTFKFKASHPATKCLQNYIETFNFNSEYFFHLIEGMEMDLQNFRCHSFEQLESYCFKVAGTVGLLSSSIFRCKESIIKPYATKLGLSLQLINILRDINEDLNLGRFYFPQDELKEFELKESDFKKNIKNKSLESFFSFQIKRIEGIYKESQVLLPNSCKENQIPSIIMGKIYIAILKKIKKNPLDTLTKKIHISPLIKVFISISSFFNN